MTSTLRPARLDWSRGVPFSMDFGDVYFSEAGGMDETTHVYLEQNQLASRFRSCTGNSSFTIAETGFGTGLNWLATMSLWQRESSAGWLHYVSVEKHPLALPDLEKAQGLWPAFHEFAAALQKHYPRLLPGFHRIALPQWRSTLTLYFGDVADMLPGLVARVDAWFLDGFAPARNPEMWTSGLYEAMARLSQPSATLATFTAAGHVRRGLQAAGFHVEKVAGFGLKREMLRGQFHHQDHKTETPWLARPASVIHQKKAIVIGAGIAGCSTAARLAMRGWSITVIEANAAPAMGASGNPAAILYPKLGTSQQASNHFPQQAWLFTLAQMEQLPVDMGLWHPCGVIQLLSGNQRYRRDDDDHHPWFQSLVMRCDAEEASRYAGISLSHEALWFPDGGWLDATGYCKALLQHPNIQLKENTQVEEIRQTATGWQIMDATGSVIDESPVVVLANALSARELDVSSFLPLQAVRGQVSMAPASSLSAALNTVVCHDGYISPSLDNGHHCIGATFQPDNESLIEETGDHVSNQHTLGQHMPELAESLEPVSAWSGRASIRCQSPDYLPLVGPLANISGFRTDYAGLMHGRVQDYPQLKALDGLYVNLAHGSKGFSQGLLCAEILAAEICNEPAPVSREILNSLHPMRFAARDIKRGK